MRAICIVRSFLGNKKVLHTLKHVWVTRTTMYEKQYLQKNLFISRYVFVVNEASSFLSMYLLCTQFEFCFEYAQQNDKKHFVYKIHLFPRTSFQDLLDNVLKNWRESGGWLIRIMWSLRVSHRNDWR